MASRNTSTAHVVGESGAEMPRGEMAAPPGPSTDMPSGDMPGEEVSAFVPATGEMPRGGMGEPAGGVRAGVTLGIEAAALSEMPTGDMGRVEAAAVPEPPVEITGTWRLLLTSTIFRSNS